ncbi:MAG: hypothetical protein IT324_27255 [Anaerolineae bacterium]|nr:hypothetical protein [Anaerolineae bacterium]
MNTQLIMVQMAERQWTIDALHLACAMARGTGAEVALIRMINVPHIQWLGTDMAYCEPTAAEQRDMQSYAAIASEYGVTLTVNALPYSTLLDAIADTAEYLDADVVFASIPKSATFYWRRFQVWNLRRRLARQGRELYTLDKPADVPVTDWTPAVLVSHAQH